ncbi:MAG: hypothetical protein IT410_02555 [Candidatus Doudnabacteria bacterium]|nr:hypothetical protein [Candidatus Doudnabacteria bacterium]
MPRVTEETQKKVRAEFMIDDQSIHDFFNETMTRMKEGNPVIYAFLDYILNEPVNQKWNLEAVFFACVVYRWFELEFGQALPQVTQAVASSVEEKYEHDPIQFCRECSEHLRDENPIVLKLALQSMQGLKAKQGMLLCGTGFILYTLLAAQEAVEEMLPS